MAENGEVHHKPIVLSIDDEGITVLVDEVMVNGKRYVPEIERVDMTDHADTIRRRLEQFAGSEGYRHAEERQGNALAALDALLAELRQAQEERDIQHERANALGIALDGQLDENDRLSDQRREAIDALRKLAHPGQRGFVYDSSLTVREFARAALVSLGEQP